MDSFELDESTDINVNNVNDDDDVINESMELNESDFPLIPLTFDTSFDLKQKLRSRNLLPPSQLMTQQDPNPRPVARVLLPIGPDGDHSVPHQGHDEPICKCEPIFRSCCVIGCVRLACPPLHLR